MLKITTVDGPNARKKILKGATKISRLVGMSLGPFGRNAIIKKKYSPPEIVGDGATIARNIMLDDEIEDLGAQALIEGSMKTDERVGDGTTSTMVIASRIVEEYAKKIEEEDLASNGAGLVGDGSESVADVNKMAREIIETGKIVIEKLKSKPLKKEQLKHVISSALGTLFPEFVDKLADTIQKVGKDGYVSVDDNWATKYGIDTELVEGMRFTGTYATPYMINNKYKEVVMENVNILLCNYDLSNAAAFTKLMKEHLDSGQRKLVIIANKFEKPFIKLMAASVINARRGNTNLTDVLAIKAPSLTTEQMQDVAVYIGATFYDKNRPDIIMKKAHLSDFGFAKKVVVDEHNVQIMDGRGTVKIEIPIGKDEKIEEEKTAVELRIEQLKIDIENEKDNAFKEQTKRRLGALQSGFATIRVGAATEPERMNFKKKLEDAVHSAQNAMDEGVVKGGGLALKEIADELGEKHNMYLPLTAPYDRIQKSSGGELKIPDTVIDPLKVVRIVVETACSVAAYLLTVEVAIAERSKTLWDELDAKLNPQEEVADDFRDDENLEQQIRT